jgi:DHA2 family multidrug resistance protein
MIIAGFILLAVASFLLGEINLQISIVSVIWPNFLMGFAIGMIFVPLTTIAVGTLPNEMIGTGTGLYNLMRGMGGSIGIAIVTTLIARHTQLHQSQMVSYLTPYNPAFRESFRKLTELFCTQYDAVTAMKKAYQSIYGVLTIQSALWAFIDNFRLIGFFSIVGVPLTMLFKNVSSKRVVKRAVTD